MRLENYDYRSKMSKPHWEGDAKTKYLFTVFQSSWHQYTWSIDD